MQTVNFEAVRRTQSIGRNGVLKTNRKESIRAVNFEAARYTHSIGRNGVLKTKGVSVWSGHEPADKTYQKWVPVINLSPITSRGNIGNCLITLPADEKAIGDLIKALRKVLGQCEQEKQEAGEQQ